MGYKGIKLKSGPELIRLESVIRISRFVVGKAT